MSVWLFIWLMVILKIPVVALLLLVRWAVGQTPETAPDGEGGIGPSSHPHHPYHPRSRLPRSPRRGPHGDPSPSAPARVRTVVARARHPARDS